VIVLRRRETGLGQVFAVKRIEDTMGEIREPLRELTECGLPMALEVMGERWSFMILRASFNGLHHFEEFLSELGIARNILSNRLGRLVEHGILERQPMAEDRRKIEYRLTEKGMDLLPAMIALRQWGQKYGAEVVENPVLVDERDRLPIGPVSILSQEGRILGPEDLALVERANVGKRADGSQAKSKGTVARGDRAHFEDLKGAA
jgi:DNA-binding HxlR family transcriptional regulator